MKKKARDILIKYLGEQYSSVISEDAIMDGIPENSRDYIYNACNCDPCWSFIVPPEVPRLGGSRLVCVSKETGRIIHDRIVGD